MKEPENFQLVNGKWVTATYVKYPPTFREKIKHWLGFCELCFICRDKKMVELLRVLRIRRRNRRMETKSDGRR